MLKRRYEVLLSFRSSEEPPPRDRIELKEALSELLKRFQRVWIDKRHHDGTRCFTVDVDDTPDNRQFFANLKGRLHERFKQIEVHIVSFPVEVL